MVGGTGRLLARPIFIIGVHRSGTSMLFRLMMAAPGLFSMRTEGRYIFWQRHHPSARGWDSEVLTAADLLPDDPALLEQAFYRLAVPNRHDIAAYRYPGAEMDQDAFHEEFTAYIRQRNKMFRTLYDLHIDRDHPMEQALRAMKEAERPLRFLEKTPSNCLHVDFIDAAFPDALFIYIKRDGRANVSSLMEGWRLEHERFGFDLPLPLRIPGVEEQKWRAILPPGWQDYVDRPLEEVATFQWLESNRIALEHLARVDPARVHHVFYEDVVDHTVDEMARICAFAGVPFEGEIVELAEQPPVVASITPPERDKWQQQNGEAIARMWPRMVPMMRQLGYTG